ncbi:unnamed protein product [Vicia faba]|uniref:Uncharacterized protein n=1 Tax=Vicia faba TaxID=3906 RepID=A0AAV0YWX8_VICFA|nr:unnamed protein product [Vicia faba]
MEDVWTMKRELPDFMGTDPVGWISVAEKFFEKNKIHSEDELQWAFMSMEDEGAMLWFYYWCEENPDADWNSPSMTMTREFGAQMVQNQESKPKLWKVTETHDEPKLEEMNFTVEREAEGYAKVESDSKEIVDIVIETDYRKRGTKAL